jgi:hypothetical protein
MLLFGGKRGSLPSVGMWKKQRWYFCFVSLIAAFGRHVEETLYWSNKGWRGGYTQSGDFGSKLLRD